ncbi:MAG TPA: hypothetical protein VFK40_14155 [Nitrososphaeraceae archaeon]|nr:hypothetical protein [Nitrososphaeraceae archaeon]
MDLLVNPNNPSPNVIFEYSEFRRDTGLLLLKTDLSQLEMIIMFFIK